EHTTIQIENSKIVHDKLKV
ncbi:hypothetical protein, partial [Bacillus manliponensis]